MIKNEKGRILYGLHFYPGVAEYADPGKQPFRVFLNEDTLRSMDPSFAGRPVFVHHVDDVNQDINELRGEADGWVIESFFNQSDGKHWVKFIVVSEKAEQAIKRGWRLSNCYVSKSYAQGGVWNGVSYAKEVKGGEYEHLAIVPNPRYEESVIMTPEQFKAHNEAKLLELERLSNGKDKKGEVMKLPKVFKREKVENSAVDLETLVVVLPKSGKEVPMLTLVNAADEDEEKKKKKENMANGDDHVDMGEKHGGKMTVNDVIQKHQAMYDELEAFKKMNVDTGGEEAAEEGGDVDHTENDDDDDDDDTKAEEAVAMNEAAEKKKNELEAAAKKKADAKAKATRLKNADKRDQEDIEVATVSFSADKVARGKSRYGS